MAEASEEFVEALSGLQQVTGELTPEQAFEQFDETSLQVFWRDWPDISSWAGALWRRLNQDLARPATPVEAGGGDTGGGD